jgi:hypothetical protein
MFIPKPSFPNVPKLPGVPQVLRQTYITSIPPVIGLGVALGRLWQALFTEPQWAIYKQQPPKVVAESPGVIPGPTVVAKRTPVVKPDSFLEFGYRNESTISDYPVQDGGFASYDKVANPYETFVRMSKGGSKAERKIFIDSLDDIVDTLDLYDILTPEKTFVGVNVLRYEINRRGNKDAYFFAEVDLYFREIRQVQATYATTSVVTQHALDPSAAPVANDGVVPVQGSTLTPEQASIPTGEAGE